MLQMNYASLFIFFLNLTEKLSNRSKLLVELASSFKRVLKKLVGLVLLLSALLVMQACSGNIDETNANIPNISAEVYNSAAEKQYFQTKTSQNFAVFQDEMNSTKDDFLLGVSAFGVAQNSGNFDWASVSQAHFQKARAQDDTSSLLESYEGAAYALMARDFPIRGIWMVVPGPGFQRLVYVDQAKARLDHAVEQSPDDPIVRLLRAAVYSGFPVLFGTREEGLDEFQVVLKMIEDSDGQGVASTPEFQLEAYVNYAFSLERNGCVQCAESVWMTIIQKFPETVEGRLARQKLGGSS